MVEREKSWKQACLGPEAMLGQGIRALDQTGLRLVLVVTRNQQLLGTVSDGDIRRGLLRGLTLRDSLNRVMNRRPLVVSPSVEAGAALEIMRVNQIFQIPVVDEKKRLRGLYTWGELGRTPHRPNAFVIMAGGRGSRMMPYTQACPKPMLRVADRPILEHIIDRAKHEGFNRFVLAIHYLGEMIERHFGRGDRFGVRIEYLREKFPLGTAGALSLLKPLPDAPVVVTNGDVVTDIRYGELMDFHVRHSAVATMAVRIHEWQHPFGVVQTKGVDITGFEEKPVSRSHINAGVYALSPEAIRGLRAGQQVDMPSLFQALQVKSKRIVAYPMHEPWLDVGDPQDLATAQKSPSCRPKK